MSASEAFSGSESLHELIERFAALSVDDQRRDIAATSAYLDSAEGPREFSSLFENRIIDPAEAKNHG